MCEQAPGEWMLESSWAESHRAQVAFFKEAPSLAVPGWGMVSRSDVSTYPSPMFVDSICGGGLTLKILVEVS